MFSFKSDRGSLAAILAAATLLFVIAGRLNRVGTVSDDGTYILAARSLLSGRYVELNLPGQPPLLYPPPGFPLVLAPWVGWMPLAALKVIPLLLTLASIQFFWRLARLWFPPKGAALLTGLFAFNPLIVQFSTYVMSEPLFVLLMLSLSLWLLRLIRNERRLGESLLFGLCLGFAAWVRADGITLVTGMLWGLAIARRYRTFLLATGMSALMIGAWACRNAVVHSTQLGYGDYWLGLMMTNPRAVQSLLAQGEWLYRLYGQGILGLPEATGTIMGVAAGLVVVVGLVFTVTGLRHELRKNKPESVLVLSLSIFGILYSILHALWLSDEVRYVIPLLPLALLACGRAALPPAGRLRPAQNRILFALALWMGTSYAIADATFVRNSFRGVKPNFPEASFIWLRDHLGSQSFLLAPAPASVTLYTGLKATNLVPARDAESFRYALLERKVDHVLFGVRAWAHMALPMDDEAAVWRHRLSWMQAWPDAFTLIYRNDEEHDMLFKVNPNDRFRIAYGRAQEAFERIGARDYGGAQQAAEDSMRLDPQLLTGRNAYAVAALLSGAHRQRAETLLREAIRTWPTHVISHVNLARLLRQRGENTAASLEYDLALNAIAATGEQKSLIAQIRSERAETQPR